MAIPVENAAGRQHAMLSRFARCCPVALSSCRSLLTDTNRTKQLTLCEGRRWWRNETHSLLYDHGYAEAWAGRCDRPALAGTPSLPTRRAPQCGEVRVPKIPTPNPA